MSQGETRVQFGFLRVAHTDLGYVGGLLVTNRLGRPMEFQCTTPVRPNKTQEILYGSTLQPFLYSELIGKTLLERVAVKPSLVIVQQESLLELRYELDIPVACVSAESSPESEHSPVQLGQQWLRTHANFPEDQQACRELSKHVPNDADLIEPLERVKDALQETLKSGAA